MIKPKKRIFIVYSTLYKHLKDIAVKVIKSDTNLIADYIDETVLKKVGPKSLYETIKKSIERSSAAVIILSPDDQIEKRIGKITTVYKQPRANVLIETGLCFNKYKSNINNLCIILVKDVTLPSDILGLGIPRSSKKKKQDFDSIKSRIQEFVLDQSSSEKQPINVLFDKHYEPKYSQTMSFYPSSCISIGNVFIQEIEEIQEEFKNSKATEKEENLQRLIIYIAERSIFAGIVRQHSIEIKRKLTYCSEQACLMSLGSNLVFYEASIKILKLVLDYLNLRVKERKETYDGYSETTSFLDEYRALNEKWIEVMELIENDEHLNPIIMYLLYDYSGLTLYRIIRIILFKKGTNYVDESMNLIQKAICYYVKANKYLTFDKHKFWARYLIFDLARVTECKYRIKETTNYSKVIELYEKALELREDCLETPISFLPNHLQLQFQSEYFVCANYYILFLIDLEKKHPNTYISRIDRIEKKYNDWIQSDSSTLFDYDLIKNVINGFHHIDKLLMGLKPKK